jgi:hypothetical protein
MIEALDKAGFDKNDENSMLIVCGDCFDRGDQSWEVLNYLMSLERVKLVRGNHCDLLEKCMIRGYPQYHDVSNGTEKTINDLGGAEEGRDFYACCTIAEQRIRTLLDKMIDYFETKNYIFVHGWIPVKCNDGLPMYYRNNRKFEFNPDWRIAHCSEWEQARWLNGIDMARKGFVEPQKTIVCGHWHCSYGHMMADMEKNGPFDCIEEFGESAIWEPYYGNGVIAIDRCTAHTGKVNVLVLEDEFLENTP